MDDKWEWGEIVYVVKDFYSNIWTKDRPAVVDDDRLEGSVSETLIKVRCTVMPRGQFFGLFL